MTKIGKGYFLTEKKMQCSVAGNYLNVYARGKKRGERKRGRDEIIA